MEPTNSPERRWPHTGAVLAGGPRRALQSAEHAFQGVLAELALPARAEAERASLAFLSGFDLTTAPELAHETVEIERLVPDPVIRTDTIEIVQHSFVEGM